MSEEFDARRLSAELTSTAAAAGRIAVDQKTLDAFVESFRKGDAATFNKWLTELKLQPFCDVICRWICSKECVLMCIRLCGPPTGEITAAQIPDFAKLVARIAGQPALVKKLADIVEHGDAAAFAAFVKELNAVPLCHLLCHWVCSIRCRLMCRVICVPRIAAVRPNLAAEIGAAALAVARLAKDAKKLKATLAAVVARDCQILKGIFGDWNDCFFICEWICSWRCVLVCLPLCRQFPPLADLSNKEIRAFAKLCGDLAANQDAFPQLVAAIDAQDVKAYAALVDRLKLGPFCVQMCHWVCREICRLFCHCVCPEPQTIPIFTHVGKYQVDFPAGDFNTNGTTTDHGFAFTGTVDLKGILPTPDGNAAHQIEYRFTSQAGGKTALPNPPAGAPILGAMIPASVIGMLEYWAWDAGLSTWVFKWAQFWLNNPGAVVNIPQMIGPPKTVSVNVNTDASGWIQEPWLDDFVPGGEGRFVPGGLLAKLDTTKLTFESFDLTPAAPPLPVVAGDSVPAAQRSTKPVFQINFEARKVMGASGVAANILNNIALSNTMYKYNRHPDWAGSPPPVDTIPVLSLDILELIAGGGCNPLSGKIHAMFTAYHPYLATCDVRLEGPLPLPPVVNPPISAAGEAHSPGGGQVINISMLKPCAYILWLEATLNLTDGYTQVYGTFNDHIAFCVS